MNIFDKYMENLENELHIFQSNGDILLTKWFFSSPFNSASDRFTHAIDVLCASIHYLLAKLQPFTYKFKFEIEIKHKI